MTANADTERFRSGAEKYASYLETFEGRLRLDLAFVNLQEFLPKAKQPLRALDIGGGTGAIAVCLARVGVNVTVLDSSLPMLELAKRAAEEAGVREKGCAQSGRCCPIAKLVCNRIVRCYCVPQRAGVCGRPR